MEHGGCGFLAGQTALSAACAVPMCLWDGTQNWIDRLVHLWAFPALLSFASVGYGTNDECAIYLGCRVVRTMTPFTIELWVIVDPESIFSSLYSRPVVFPVGLFLAGMRAWNGYLPRMCTFCLITRTSLWYQSGDTLRGL